MLMVFGVLSACSSSSQQNQEPLYSGSGGVGIEARLSAVESGMRDLAREMSQRDRMIAELDQEIIALKRALADVGPAREALRSDAAAARSVLATRIERLESRLAGLDTARDATARQLEALRGMAGRAMAEAQRARALVNSQALERAGAGIDLQAPEAEEQEADGEEEAPSPPASTPTRSESEPDTAAPVMPAQGFAVHLASYTTIDAARDGWAELRREHPDLLGDREARLKLLDLGGLGGRYLRLLVGPFSDVAPANEVCKRLQESGEFCQIAAFAGDPVDNRSP